MDPLSVPHNAEAERYFAVHGKPSAWAHYHVLVSFSRQAIKVLKPWETRGRM